MNKYLGFKSMRFLNLCQNLILLQFLRGLLTAFLDSLSNASFTNNLPTAIANWSLDSEAQDFHLAGTLEVPTIACSKQICKRMFVKNSMKQILKLTLQTWRKTIAFWKKSYYLHIYMCICILIISFPLFYPVEKHQIDVL